MASLAFPKLSHCHSLVILLATLLLLCVAKTSLAEKTKPHLESNDAFIKTSCAVTRYPELCYKTLSAYADTIQDDPTQLANASLSETLKSAQSTLNMVQKLLGTRELRPKEAGAVKDCVETMKDSVYELQRSLVAMRDLQGPDFEMEMGNIQTWVSASLTDEDTCMDGFDRKAMNEKIKETIRSSIVVVSQLTSNSLALIDKLS